MAVPGHYLPAVVRRPAAVYCGDGAMASRMYSIGYSLCAISSDIAMMLESSQAQVRLGCFPAAQRLRVGCFSSAGRLHAIPMPRLPLAERRRPVTARGPQLAAARAGGSPAQAPSHGDRVPARSHGHSVASATPPATVPSPSIGASHAGRAGRAAAAAAAAPEREEDVTGPALPAEVVTELEALHADPQAWQAQTADWVRISCCVARRA